MARKGGFRHLVYFIDGTWLWAASNKTLDVYSNIYRMNLLLKDDDMQGRAQIVHYSRGLGANNGIRRYTAGGFSYGIAEQVADLYVNLCSNFERNDRIYIFGFSRGAVVARAFAGLIAKGILAADCINRFAHVWGDYIGSQEISVPGAPKGAPSPKPINSYKAYCSETNPTIEFLGVFDTVAGGHRYSSAGQQMKLREGALASNVKNAVHILALDETRRFFHPITWLGTQENVDSSTTTSRHIEQMWMPGVHSDIGGSYQRRAIGNISLITMIDRVLAKTKLNFDINACRDYNTVIGQDLVTIHNERTKFWKLLDPVPMKRSIDTNFAYSVHPICEHLDGSYVNWKKSKTSKVYKLSNEVKLLRKSKEFYTEHFRSFV